MDLKLHELYVWQKLGFSDLIFLRVTISDEQYLQLIDSKRKKSHISCSC